MYRHFSLLSCLVALLLCPVELRGQDLRFALLTDVHIISRGPSCDDLRACVKDINSRNYDFVIVAGDLSDFGSAENLKEVKGILDQLTVKYYAIPGNHDCKWSPSGATDFAKIFGSDTFCFLKGNWRFIGCPSGPDVRMAPGLVPKQTLNYLKTLPKGPASIFVCHYPVDSSLSNYHQLRAAMASLDVRFVLGGHVHKNSAMNYGGFPGALCRASKSGSTLPAGYSEVEISGDEIFITERRVFTSSQIAFSPWYHSRLAKVQNPDTCGINHNEINARYPRVREVWRFEDEGNIACGFATGFRDYAVYGSSTGTVRAISATTGQTKWTAKLQGKIYSTPAISGKLVYVGSTDGNMYALDVKKGKIKWKYTCPEAVLSSPVVFDGKLYFGSSDGCMYALDAQKGTQIWCSKEMTGYVEARPLVDSRQVVVGAWDGFLYSFDPRSGKLQWKWKSPRSHLAYSPAGCNPCKSSGRIFTAVPDRKVYAIDALTGKEVFHIDGGRESLGISQDGSILYAKTMQGEVYAFRANMASAGLSDGQVPESRLNWKKATQLGYDISPASLLEYGGMLLVPSDKGVLHCLSSSNGDCVWAHGISCAPVNPVTVMQVDGKSFILASTADGIVTRLDY